MSKGRAYGDLPGLAALLADPLLAAVAAGRRQGLLLLDYDGTLAPFQTRRESAAPYPGVVEVLRRLPAAGAGRYVVISGRIASEVAAFLSPANASEIWGRHGAERLSPGSDPQLQALTPAWEQALRQAFVIASMAAPPGAVEWKTVSVALHWRGLKAAAQFPLARFVRPQWEALGQETGLVLHAFDGGLELRPPGWDKGQAVRCLQREYPGVVLVCLGDDQTDEDAFQAVGASGISVLVRADWRPTAADYRIAPPGELLQFLRFWVNSQVGACHEPGS